MPISSPDEKQDNPLNNKSDSHQSVEKLSSPQSQQDSRNRIVDTSPKPSMAGFTVAAPKGEVHGHDSFDRGILPPMETHGPRLSKVLEVARHVADGGSEFPNEGDATSTHRKPHVSTSVASTILPTSSTGLTQTLTSTSSSLTPGTTTQFHNNRRLPSSSQHPNFAALFAARNSKIASIRAKEQQEQEDTNVTMSIEKVLPEQQVKGVPAAASKTKAKRKRTPQRKSGQSAGRWTHEEHRAFLEGLKEFGREWKKVATRIPTRTSAQIRSHAQKYFAKLQREQETSITSQELMTGVMTGDVRGSATATQSTTTPVTPSVQKNIERLMADPQAVQREVEHTLRALRERYRQLQSQLERQQQRGHPPLGAPRKPVLLQQQQPIVALEEAPDAGLVGSRKRSFQEMETSNSKSGQQQAAQNQDQDDQSSVTTNISASVASLGNEELIALHVLGGALPRNESNASLQGLPNIASKQESPASTKSTK